MPEPLATPAMVTVVWSNVSFTTHVLVVKSITCDANISTETLQVALKTNIDKTFNQITIDGDTSTSSNILQNVVNSSVFGKISLFLAKPFDKTNTKSLVDVSPSIVI
jgi:hypothetical protein